MTVNVADTPLKVTREAPVNAFPVMCTTVPRGPLVGLKVVTFGLTPKLVALVAVPIGVVTPIMPVKAPDGTVAVIAVSDPTVKVAATPLKVTDVAPVNPDPAIVTD